VDLLHAARVTDGKLALQIPLGLDPAQFAWRTPGCRQGARASRTEPGVAGGSRHTNFGAADSLLGLPCGAKLHNARLRNFSAYTWSGALLRAESTSPSSARTGRPTEGGVGKGFGRVRIAIAALMAGFMFTAAAPAANVQFSGKVIAVADGDTLTVLTDANRQVRVRLTEVDAPEGGQAWGQRSKQALSSLVFSKRVLIKPAGEDRYGRTLGRIYVGSLDVSAELVRSGSAWAYRAYLTDKALISLETQARSARRGLWSMPLAQVIAPWDWRAGERAAASSATVSSTQSARPLVGQSVSPTGGFTCGSKRYCTEMSSCLEAKFYLRQCANDGKS